MLVTSAPLPQDGRVNGRNNGCTAPSPALVHGDPLLKGVSHVFVVVKPANSGRGQAGLWDLEPHFYWKPRDGSNPRGQRAFV